MLTLMALACAMSRVDDLDMILIGNSVGLRMVMPLSRLSGAPAPPAASRDRS